MKTGQGLSFEVLGKLLEIIYFSIFTVWHFQFIFFLVISEIIKLIHKINGRISEVHSIQYQGHNQGHLGHCI